MQTLRIGAYYIDETPSTVHEFPRVYLGIYKDGHVWEQGPSQGQPRRLFPHVEVVLPHGNTGGHVSYGSTRLSDPAHVEILSLALDRAATILKKAREDAE